MKKKAACEIWFVDEEKVKKVRAAMPGGDTVLRLSQVFKSLGDPTRIKILHALFKEELCVCDLATLLGTTVSAVSHQLRLLRSLDLVRFRKEGKMAYYSLNDEHVVRLFSECLRHVEE